MYGNECLKKKRGFTLGELLIVVAIIAVLSAVAIPVFINQLEKSREATDLANVRSAYAAVMTNAINGTAGKQSVTNTGGLYSASVVLQQTKAGWVTNSGDVIIGGVRRNDDMGVHWFGDPEDGGGSCTVYYSATTYTVGGNEVNGVAIVWNGEAGETGDGGGSGGSGGDDGGEGDSGDSGNTSSIAGLGEAVSRLGSAWGSDSSTGLMSISGGSTAESASRVTLTMTPILLKNGAEVTITTESGYSTGYFLIRYDSEKGGYVKVSDSGWKTGTVSFTVSEDGLYFVANTKKTSGNLTVAEAEENVSISISGNENAISTAGLTKTSLAELSGLTAISKRALTSTNSAKIGATVHETYKTDSDGNTLYDDDGNPLISTPYYRGYAMVNLSGGQILSFTGSEDYNYAYFFLTEDNTVLFDSGWLGYGTGTSVLVPEDCTLAVQINRKSAVMTDDALNAALGNISLYR